jgi:hypothetical protein
VIEEFSGFIPRIPRNRKHILKRYQNYPTLSTGADRNSKAMPVPCQHGVGDGALLEMDVGHTLHRII